MLFFVEEKDMNEFCVGLVILVVMAATRKVPIKIEGFLSLLLVGCMCYGMGFIIVDVIPRLIK